MDNKINTIFQLNSNNINSVDTNGNLSSKKDKDDKKESSYNENRISFKLSLRKQKIQEEIFRKRGHKSLNQVLNNTNDDTKIKENDILSGVYYDYLENAYKTNDNDELKELLNSFAVLLDEIPKGNDDIRIILMKANSSKNNKINEKYAKDTNFPLSSLIFQISVDTNDKILYIYSSSLILNFTFISNEFCKEISNVEMLDKMMKRLIYFYPLFGENKKLKKKKLEKKEEAEVYCFGGQILQIFGNIFTCSENYKSFESIHFYEKIFDLLYMLELDSKHNEFFKFRLEYLDTLIWLIYLFIEKTENLIINYNEKILMIIPCLVSDIRCFYYLEENYYLGKIVEIIERISYLNIIYAQRLVESDAIKILTNLFGYLFPSDDNFIQIKLSDNIVDEILGIFVIIFTLDSKYIINLDFSSFSLVIEKLFDDYKLENSDRSYYIRNKLVILLSNLACFDDVDQIVSKFMKNNKIIITLFQYYYNEHKLETLQFIDNVLTKQKKDIRDLVLNFGGFEIIKRNICDSDITDRKIILSSINVLYKLIVAEKAYNIRLLFENIYNTSIPEKIKEIFFDKDIQNENEHIIKLIITDFETYEKSLEEKLIIKTIIINIFFHLISIF